MWNPRVSKRWPMVLFGGAGVVLCSVITFHVHGQPSEEIGDFMRPKLQHSQRLLEGLALGDFELIQKEAQELSLLSQASNWQVLQTEEYLHQSEQFRRAASKVRAAAKAKNLEGATLGYFDMTLQCVNCHEHLRGVQMAKAQ